MIAKCKKTPRKKLKTAAAVGTGWITSDEEEVECRRLRAREEARTVRAVKPATGKPDLYSDYRVSGEGGWYHVEFRDKHRSLNESLDAFRALQRTVYEAGLSSAQLKISAYIEPWLAYRPGHQAAQRDSTAIGRFLAQADEMLLELASA